MQGATYAASDKLASALQLFLGGQEPGVVAVISWWIRTWSCH